jgi:HD-like signal output (HDOD) protein
MPSSTWIALFVASIAFLAVVAALVLRRRANAAFEAAALAFPAPDPGRNTDTPYASEATAEVDTHYFKLAFGIARLDDAVFDDHLRVVEQVEKALADVVEQREYFPRRPLLLPKLLQALNDTESTRGDLVRLILEDPALAGATLQRANTAFYRMSKQPVESLDRAVAVLGTEGLRSLVSLAILQPVFQLPKGSFDRFPELAWEKAQRSAAGAEAYAAAVGESDPLVAQVLGVLRSLALLVLFRLTLAKYRTVPDLTPRPEVFIRIMQAHRSRLAREIAKTWQLSDASLAALDEQCRELSPLEMSPLGCAVYYGELAGTLGVAMRNGIYSADGAQTILLAQGLTPRLADQVLDAAKLADWAT